MRCRAEISSGSCEGVNHKQHRREAFLVSLFPYVRCHISKEIIKNIVFLSLFLTFLLSMKCSKLPASLQT